MTTHPTVAARRLRGYVVGVVLLAAAVALAVQVWHGSATASSARTAAAPVPGGPAQIGVIGDSLTAEPAFSRPLVDGLEALGWRTGDIRVDGQWGRGINRPGPGATQTAAPYTLDVVRSWRAEGFDPQVWVIGLGTNNALDGAASWRAGVAAVVSEIRSGPRRDYAVYWVGTGYSQAGAFEQAAFDATLADLARRTPGLVFCDYESYLRPRRADARWESWWDGIHNTQAGYAALRVPFYLEAVQDVAPGDTHG
ncbi:hypothetical protein AWH69_00115 [Janibacter melonis]|uniref:SGNH hydrolase-type esterase domain-containing protein n=1 Tax=Janibacter melonis TaxID=262209 RepID=A0A176QEP8_9MICO|nr:SGNH/GDSL hydrolase family protein [Janibacter melonis]OAB88265.1 hypothetical protein AWH69_00115 [Janibacter melonis]